MRADAGADRFVYPVGGGSGEHALQLLVVNLLVVEVVCRVFGVVEAERVLEREFLLCVEIVVRREVGGLDVDAYLCVDAQFSGLRLACGDDDDAVRASRTVDGCGGGIFQDVDGFYFLVVVVHQFLERNLEAVENDEWRVDGVAGRFVELLHAHGQRRVASDVDLRQVVRVAARQVVHLEVHRCVDGLQCLQQVLSLVQAEFLAADLRDGAGVALLRLLEDAGYDNLSHRLAVFFHRDVHLLPQGQGDGLHADACHLHVLRAGHHVVERVGAVDICHRHGCRTEHFHLRPDDGFAFLVADISAVGLHLPAFVALCLAHRHLDELAFDLIDERLVAEHVIHNLHEFHVLHRAVDPVFLHIVEGEEELVVRRLLQSQQHARQLLVPECHRQTNVIVLRKSCNGQCQHRQQCHECFLHNSSAWFCVYCIICFIS